MCITDKTKFLSKVLLHCWEKKKTVNNSKDCSKTQKINALIKITNFTAKKNQSLAELFEQNQKFKESTNFSFFFFVEIIELR